MNRTKRQQSITIPLQRQTIRLPIRMQSPCQNLMVRPFSSTSSTKNKKNDNSRIANDLGRAMNMTTLNQLKRMSINSIGKQAQPQCKEPRRTGLKYNRVRMLGINNLHKKYKNKQSLYDKSLRKANSVIQRKDFEESIKEITTKQYLASKRSLINKEDMHKRYKSEMYQPESATIIIQLKKLYNNKAQYSFVHNHYEPSVQQREDDAKRDEQIFSTTHTNININDHERMINNTHGLFLRNRQGKSHTAHVHTRKQKMTKNTSKEHQLIPWLKQSERALSQFQFEPFALDD